MEPALERTPGSCGIGCNWTTMELNVHFCPVSKCTIHPICCEDFGITMLEGNDEYLCISCHVRSLSRSYVNGVLEEAYDDDDDDYNDNNFAENIDQASDLLMMMMIRIYLLVLQLFSSLLYLIGRS